MPPGYRDFILAHGQGTYCRVLSVHPPDRVVTATAELRGYFPGHTQLWSNAADVVTTDEATWRRGFQLGSSLDGDVLAFVGGTPERLRVLPRQRQVIDEVGPTFAHALAWFSHSGRYWTLAETLTYDCG